MIKKLIFLALFTPSISLATQCPAVSEWSHVQGEPWKLNSAAQARGWKVTESDDNETATNQVPQHARLNVYIGNGQVSCRYFFHIPGHSTTEISAQLKQDIDGDDLPDPPFYHNRLGEYFCDAYAYDEGYCAWS